MHQTSSTNKDTRGGSHSVPPKGESSAQSTVPENSFEFDVQSLDQDPKDRDTSETTTEREQSTLVAEKKASELRAAGSGKALPDGRTTEQQELAGGGALSALLPVTPSAILGDVEITTVSTAAANDETRAKPSGIPGSERQVPSPRPREDVARRICLTPSGTPQVQSPDTRGDWNAAIHALYPSGSADENYRKTSVSGLCCLLIVLPTAAVTVVYILAYIKARSQPVTGEVGISPLAELAEACPGTYADWPVSGCHQVMSAVLEASNPQVAPCDDFYEHVCGWWSRWKDSRSSQVKEHVRAFNNRVMSTLLNASRDLGASRKAPRTISDQMALFYSSCFAMAFTSGDEGGNADDVMTALGMNVKTWVDSPSFGSLLELVVSSSLRTGLPSVITLSFKEGTYSVDVGKTLSSTFAKYGQVDGHVIHGFIRDLNDARGGSDTMTNASAAILELDSVLEKIRRLIGRESAVFVYVSLDQLMALTDFDVKWTRALELGLPVWLRNATISSGHRLFRVREAAIIVRLVDRLRPEPLRLVGLYALVVLIAQIMKYKASMKQPVETFSTADRVLWCLKQTATHFSAVYPAWVAAKFQDKEDADKLRAIFDHVVATISRDNRVNAGVVVLTRRLKRARLVILGGASSYWSLPTTKIPVSLGDRFLPNLAQLVASRVGRVDDAAVRTSLLQLNGHFGFSGDDFVVATAFVHRTTMYSRFAREDTRYATLGVLILRKLFESDSAYNPQWSAHYVNNCFAASVSSTLGRSPVGASASHPTGAPEQDGGAEVKPFMGSRWAVQLAWRMHHAPSSPFRESGVAKNGSTSSKFARLFFRMAFFARCGEPRARDECNDFAKFAPELAAAYECPGERKGVCDECAAAQRCETHMPQIT